MKYTEEDKLLIDGLHTDGLSSRAISKLTGFSKSGINDYLKTQDFTLKVNGPRILVLDVETAATVALSFGRFKINLSQNNIITEGGWMLCASWRWLGEEDTYSIRLSSEEVLSQDDFEIAATLYSLYEQADAIVAHNGCSFDHKVIQTRATANGFPPLPTVKVLDTLLLAKKYLRLPSNKLDSIGEYFGLGRKIDTGGIDLWRRVQSGDVEAMLEMTEYCEQDVNLLYNVYMRLRQLGQAGNALNAGLYYDDDHTRCNVCGSLDIEPTGRTTKTTLSVFEEYRCNGCGAVHKTRTSLTTKQKRKKTLLIAS